jgi:hypothetical protein
MGDYAKKAAKGEERGTMWCSQNEEIGGKRQCIWKGRRLRNEEVYSGRKEAECLKRKS